MSKLSKKILIAAGGTGGHIFPAQALARQLEEKGHTVLFMGKGLSTNKYFDKESFLSKSIDSATPFRRGIFKKLSSVSSLGKGVLQAISGIREFQPDLVVGFGSYHAFPVLAAAFLKRVPMALFESNSIPGKVNKLFSSCSRFCAVQFPQAKEKLKGSCYEVKMPFCPKRKRQGVERVVALDYFSLPPDSFTVLVFGGSQGATFINPIIARALNELHQENSLVQVIHMTGCEVSAEEVKLLYLESGIAAHVKPFEENMHYAWASADLVICRAGAATIAEAVEFEVPSILIPYPTASNQHQLKNAEFVSSEVKGSRYLEEKNLSPKELLILLKECNILDMKRSIQTFKENKRRRQLIDHIEEELYK